MMWLVALSHSYSQDKEPTCLCYLDGDNSPAGLMGAHTHEKNGWMISYNYARVNMSGMQSGTSLLSEDYVFNKYIMSESKMSMDMHMLMLMYGITDRLSAILMTSYSVNTMNMDMIESTMMTMPDGGNGVMKMTSTNRSMSEKYSGLNDVVFCLNYSLAASEHHTLIASAGVSIPTGSIGAVNANALVEGQRYTYNMPPGSGTWDVLPRLTYIYNTGKFFAGSQVSADLHTGYNSIGYRQGDLYSFTAWTSYRFFKPVGISLRGLFMYTQSISGSDPYLYTIIEPSADAANSGSRTFFVVPGVNVYPGFINGCTLGIEYAKPLYQYFNGIQMPFHSQWMLKAQIAF